jgi:GT2 family glycosyltransferase
VRSSGRGGGVLDFDLSVTICSWNTRDDLRDCLRSLREAAGEARFEVIVVDNASADGSPEMVEAEFPEVVLLRQTANLGFTGGQNLAIARRRGRDAFLLNSDAMVTPGAIASLFSYARANPDIGAIGPKVLNPDGSLQYSCRRFPNPLAALFRNTPLGRWFPNNRFTRDYLMQDWDHMTPREVDWVSGAALYATKEFIARVGLLDEGFFMFCEDVDWCKRCHEAGMKVVYLPQAVVIHAIGRSTDKAANRMIIRFHRSMLRYYAKHDLPRVVAVARPIAWLAAAAALSARALLFVLRNWRDALRRRIAR